MSDARHPHDAWARRPDESAKAHAACMVYLRLGEGRSIAKAGQAMGRPNRGYQTTMFRWSVRYGWVERARAYDAEQDRVLWAEALVKRDKALRRITDETDTLVGDAIKIATGEVADPHPQRVAMLRDLLTRAGLMAPKVTTTRAETERAPDGATETTTTTTTEDVATLTPDQLARAYAATIE